MSTQRKLSCMYVQVCLPTLRPIVSLIGETVAKLRNIVRQSKRGSKLLMEMLIHREQPRQATASPMMTAHVTTKSFIDQDWLSAIDGELDPEIEAAEVPKLEVDRVQTSIMELEALKMSRVEMEGASPERAVMLAVV